MSAVPSPEKAIHSHEDEATKKTDVAEFVSFLPMLPFALIGRFLFAGVLLLLWSWFIVPLGVRHISYWHSFGLTALISFVRYSGRPSKEEKRDARYWKEYVSNEYSAVAYFFVIGWIAHLIMLHQ